MMTKLLFLHAFSPLHAGTGQGVGAIDLPIAREKATGIPLVPGSTIKGVLRSEYTGPDKEKVFGPETENASDHAGAVQFSDLQLLFLPVRSLAGTFAWVTSPLLLQRYQRDVALANAGLALSTVPTISGENTCLVVPDPALVFPDRGQNRVVLEDLDLRPQEDASVQAWAQTLAPQIFGNDATAQLFPPRVCVVHDNVMAYLLDVATEVVARIQLDPEKKTVKQGALWYEESLPAESILVGLILAQPPAKIDFSEAQAIRAVQSLSNQLIQVGGSATVGRGLCRIHIV